MTHDANDRVSRLRYNREKAARAEAEALLEAKSRQLFLANKQLSENAAALEHAVTERTSQLQSALENAQAASLARSRFIATMSHEIRTPLGGLLGMIDLLGMDETDDKKNELLEFARTAGRGLSRIVNDVLDFSKMEAGVFVFEEEHVDIRALVESVRALAQANPNSANRPILVKIQDSFPQIFLGDATRIRQVISNLINNAIRYSTDGPIIVRGTTTPHEKGALLRIEVEDFGIGIADTELDNLFKDFSQITNSLTAAAQGAGLGLAICKRILESCGGQIGVNSTLGQGSIFWFELAAHVVVQSGQQGGDTPPAPRRESLMGKRVLIAEDNIINQKLLMTYAKRMGLKPVLAQNGRIALDLFTPDDFDLVLMDVAMPEMDGLEATRRIREKWVGHSLPPILALTAHVMDAVEHDAKQVGIDVILSKPIPFDDLKLTLEIALGQSLSRRAPAAVDVSTAAENAGTICDIMAPDIAAELREMFTLEDLVELAKNYVIDANERLENIRAAYNQNDEQNLRAQAHSIKGSSLVFGFHDMSEHAHFIEKHTAADTPDIPATLVQMQSMLDDIQSYL